MSFEGCGSRSWSLVTGGVRGTLASRRMEQRGEVVFAVAVAPLGVGRVHGFEVRPEHLLVPDELPGPHVRGDRADPHDLGLVDGDRVFQLEEHEAGKTE